MRGPANHLPQRKHLQSREATKELEVRDRLLPIGCAVYREILKILCPRQPTKIRDPSQVLEVQCAQPLQVSQGRKIVEAGNVLQDQFLDSIHHANEADGTW